MDIELSVIDYQSPYYADVLKLRNEVLRIPIGLDLYDEDLSEDKNQYIVIALMEQQVIACVMLKILDKETIKLRQMAVKEIMQKKGFGITLMKYAENFCALNEYTDIELHARETAVNFYLKLGYKVVSEQFEEVGIPHFKMTKKLNS